METRRLDADVLIAGGGPAGSAAAIGCAEAGLRVVLVERHLFTQERPGEALHPGVEPLLAQLGVADRLASVTGARFPGIWVRWAEAARFEPFGGDAEGPWRGFQVSRKAFDGLLLERAREVGVDVRQPCPVLDLAPRDDGLQEVLTGAGPVTCRIVIDATGGARWLSRKRGLAAARHSPRLIARFGYAEGTCPERDDAPAFEAGRSGWTGTARVRPGVYGWVRVDFDGPSRRDKDAPGPLRALTPRGLSRGADVTWRLSRAAAGPGWFIVGDAGATLDPASSRGVLKAIMSGAMAGHLATGVLKGGVPMEKAAAAYRGWLAGWFAADAERLAGLYRELGVEGFGRAAQEQAG